MIDSLLREMDNALEIGTVSSDDVILCFKKEINYKIVNLVVESKKTIGLKIIIETAYHLMLLWGDSFLKKGCDRWKKNHNIL